jgi:hypothetical protein
VRLGNGQFNSHWHKSALLAFRLEVHAHLSDGKVAVVTSSAAAKWKDSPAPSTSNDVYLGEVYDNRLNVDGWALPGYDDSAWSPSQDVPSTAKFEPSTAEMSLHAFTPIRIVGTRKPVYMHEVAADSSTDGNASSSTDGSVFVLDFGTNFVGWVAVSPTVGNNALTYDTLTYAALTCCTRMLHLHFMLHSHAALACIRVPLHPPVHYHPARPLPSRPSITIPPVNYHPPLRLCAVVCCNVCCNVCAMCVQCVLQTPFPAGTSITIKHSEQLQLPNGTKCLVGCAKDPSVSRSGAPAGAPDRSSRVWYPFGGQVDSVTAVVERLHSYTHTLHPSTRWTR